jgi:phenylpropionate dioxygenase-like ring-hydroxylating dioxygenase large terminal subunit
MATTLRRQWLVACASEELSDRPLARTVLDTPLVLFRSAGRAIAFLDRCPHRNAPLSAGRVEGGMLACPYHGWTFDAEGRCRAVPGLDNGAALPGRGASPVAIAERDGLVFVRLDGDRVAPSWPGGPAPSDPAFDSFSWVTEAQCALVDGIENLLDASHPHFVHSGLVRGGRRRPMRVTVRRDHEKAEAVYEEDGVADGWIPRLLEGRRTASIGRFYPPSTAQLEYRGPHGPRFVMTAFFTPAAAPTVRIHAIVATPRGLIPAALKRVVLRRLLAPVVRQDHAILRLQHENIARFGGPAFTSTPVDVLRPHILRLMEMKKGEGETPPPFETTLTLRL